MEKESDESAVVGQSSQEPDTQAMDSATSGDTANALKELSALAANTDPTAAAVSLDETKVNGQGEKEKDVANATVSTSNGKQQLAAESDVPSNFEFKYNGDGYDYFTDPEGNWYARDEFKYWYYQDADGKFQLWSEQAGNATAATKDVSGTDQTSLASDSVSHESEGTAQVEKTSSAVELSNAQDNANAPAAQPSLPDQNVDHSAAKNDVSVSSEAAMDITDDDNYKSVVPISADGHPQYPRRSDGKPLLPIGPDGNKVFPLGRDGNPIFPVDDDGRPTFPLGDDGQPVFPIGLNDKPIVPLDVNGVPVFPLAEDGTPIFPLGQDGKPCAPVTVDGRSVLPRDAEGKPIVPYGHDGQPLILVGPDGSPVEGVSASAPPPPPLTQPENDWNAYYQQYYQQYYNYQQYYYPYNTSGYGNTGYGSYGGHSYAGFSGLMNPTPPQPTIPKRSRVRPEDIDLPPGPPPPKSSEPVTFSGRMETGTEHGDHGKKDSDQKMGGSDDKQSATRQLVARQLKAFSMINQFKKESENRAAQAESAKGPLPSQQQPATGTRRSRFDVTDKGQQETSTTETPPSGQKIGFGPVSVPPPSLVREDPPPPGVEPKHDRAEKNRSRSRSPAIRRSPPSRSASPHSPTRNRRRRSSSHSPRRRSRSPSPSRYGRNESNRGGRYRKDEPWGRGRYRGRFPRRSPRGRTWRGNSRDQYRDRSPKFEQRDDRKDRSVSASRSRSSAERSSRSRSRSRQRDDSSVSPKKEAKEIVCLKKEVSPMPGLSQEEIWTPDSYRKKPAMVRSSKDDGAAIQWPRDKLAKTRTEPCLWYSCRLEEWPNFQRLFFEKEKRHAALEAIAEEGKENQAIQEEENLEAQMYGPKIAPAAPAIENVATSGKWKPVPPPEEKRVSVEHKEERLKNEKSQKFQSSEDGPAETMAVDESKRKKKEKDLELDRLRYAALATMEQAKRDYEYYVNLAKQQKSPGSDDEHEEAEEALPAQPAPTPEVKKHQKDVSEKGSKRKRKAKSGDEDEDGLSTSSSAEDRNKKRRKLHRKKEEKRKKQQKRKRRHRHRHRRSTTDEEDEDERDNSDDETNVSDQVSSSDEEEKHRRKKRKKTISLSSKSDDDSEDEEERKKSKKKRKNSSRRGKAKDRSSSRKLKKKKHSKRKSTDEDEDQEKSDSDQNNSDSDLSNDERGRKPKRRRHKSSVSESSSKGGKSKKTRSKPTKAARKKRKSKRSDSSSDGEHDERRESVPKKRKRQSSDMASTDGRGKSSSTLDRSEQSDVLERSGETQQVKRGFFTSAFDASSAPATLPDIPLPRECYSNAGSKLTSQKQQPSSSPPPPPPKQKRKKSRLSRDQSQSPPPPPPPRKSDFVKQQFGSPQPKGGPPASTQQVFIPVATYQYRPVVPPPAGTHGSTAGVKQFPYGSGR